MHTKKDLDELLRLAKISPQKKLGQNFLLNPAIIQKVISASQPEDFDQVIEIGPGLGALTEDLLKTSKKLHLVELDRGLVEYWRGRNLEIEIHHEDALQLDWSKFEGGKTLLISNLPYSIAGSLVLELSTLSILSRMVLMFQKEVAQRIQAQPKTKDYGILSIVGQNFWNIEKVLDAGPQDFFPVPNVGSRVLRFDSKNIKADKPKFLQYAKAAFSQRRKKLKSNLISLYSNEKINEVFGSLKIDENTRAEDLDPATHLKLWQTLIF